MHYHIYLSATFHPELPANEGFDWKKALIDSINKRDDFKEENSITFIDPLLFNSIQKPVAVEADMDNISNADVVFFYIQKPTIGTLMELMFASMNFPNQKRYLIASPEVATHTWICNLGREKPYFGGNKRLYPLTICHSVQEAVDNFMNDVLKTNNA